MKKLIIWSFVLLADFIQRLANKRITWRLSATSKASYVEIIIENTFDIAGDALIKAECNIINQCASIDAVTFRYKKEICADN
jgi:hypothetical protein